MSESVAEVAREIGQSLVEVGNAIAVAGEKMLALAGAAAESGNGAAAEPAESEIPAKPKKAQVLEELKAVERVCGTAAVKEILKAIGVKNPSELKPTHGHAAIVAARAKLKGAAQPAAEEGSLDW